jgi:hypothetical protein
MHRTEMMEISELRGIVKRVVREEPGHLDALRTAQQMLQKVLEANRGNLIFLANLVLSEETIGGAELPELLADCPKEAPLAAD